MMLLKKAGTAVARFLINYGVGGQAQGFLGEAQFCDATHCVASFKLPPPPRS
jgi:hypothetical protein